jgi:hypothetical protein
VDSMYLNHFWWSSVCVRVWEREREGERERERDSKSSKLETWQWARNFQHAPVWVPGGLFFLSAPYL